MARRHATRQRIDNIEIPDRPAVASDAAGEARLRESGVLLYGGIAAAALLVVVVIALLWSGDATRSRVRRRMRR